MRRRIKSWVSRLFIDTTVEIVKLRELASKQVEQINGMTRQMKELNDDRIKTIADLNDTNDYWQRKEACGDSERTES